MEAPEIRMGSISVPPAVILVRAALDGGATCGPCTPPGGCDGSFGNGMVWVAMMPPARGIKVPEQLGARSTSS